MRTSAFALFPLLVACGGTPVARHVVTPMTPEAEVAFENGIDFLGDPTLLEGSWLEDWDRDLRNRSELSDAVLLVHVRSIHENEDLDRNRSYRLSVHVETIRFGTGVPDELTFVSREHEAGYATVNENEARLLDEQFVAFVRWVETPEGEIVPRWHLSPASPGVMRRVNQILNGRRHTRPRTVTVTDGREPGSDEEEE